MITKQMKDIMIQKPFLLLTVDLIRFIQLVDFPTNDRHVLCKVYQFCMIADKDLA